MVLTLVSQAFPSAASRHPEWPEGALAVRETDYRFRYEFAKPNPLFIFCLAQYGNFMVVPEHHYKNFHPGYVSSDDLKARIDELGFISWLAFVGASRRGRIEASVDAPTLDAFDIVARNPNSKGRGASNRLPSCASCRTGQTNCVPRWMKTEGPGSAKRSWLPTQKTCG